MRIPFPLASASGNHYSIPRPYEFDDFRDLISGTIQFLSFISIARQKFPAYFT
jgi:hypothetical protein